jgi:hypothetical protein
MLHGIECLVFILWVVVSLAEVLLDEDHYGVWEDAI